MILAHKQELFGKRRRDMIWKFIELMRHNCQVSTNTEPYRVALFWLDVADKTWGWKACA